jgi:hypothetical protein
MAYDFMSDVYNGTILMLIGIFLWFMTIAIENFGTNFKFWEYSPLAMVATIISYLLMVIGTAFYIKSLK